MSINLSKNEKINLSKTSNNGLKDITLGLGWSKANIVTHLGRFLTGKPVGDFDLDSWVVLGKDNRFELSNLCYYHELELYSNYKNGDLLVKHHGDNLVGGAKGDCERITIHLDKIPTKFNQILIGVTIFKGEQRKQVFKDVKNTFIRLIDNKDGSEMCRYEEEVSKTCGNCVNFIVGILTKENNEWIFKPIGDGIESGDIADAIRKYSEILDR